MKKINIFIILFFLILGYIKYASAEPNRSPDLGVPDIDFLSLDYEDSIELNQIQPQLLFRSNAIEKKPSFFKPNISPDIALPDIDFLSKDHKDSIELNQIQPQLLFRSNATEKKPSFFKPNTSPDIALPDIDSLNY